MKCELCCDNDCLDLLSLTKIWGNSWNGSKDTHVYMGRVILESMI